MRMSAYIQTTSPHIFHPDSVSKRNWKQSAALLPIVLAVLFVSKWNGFQVILAAISGGMIGQWLFAKVSKAKMHFDGQSLLFPLLFSLMLPFGAPYPIAFAGGFISTVIGKEFFGGAGAYPFHPSMLALLIVQLSFPAMLSGAHGWTHEMALPDLAWGYAGGRLITSASAALSVSVLLLLWMRVIAWDASVVFLVTLVLFAYLLGEAILPLLAMDGVLFAAFFLITETVSTPTTRRGHRLFACLAAVTYVLFRVTAAHPTNLPCSILLANSLTPLLDHWIRPRLSYPKQENRTRPKS